MKKKTVMMNMGSHSYPVEVEVPDEDDCKKCGKEGCEERLSNYDHTTHGECQDCEQS